jgi:agmatinase
MKARDPWGGLAGAEPVGRADAFVLGLPYDGSACWRQGAAEAPVRLREISATSPAVSEDGFAVDPSSFRVVDLGDVAPRAADLAEELGDAARRDYFSRVERAALEALQPEGRPAGGSFLLSIGGDHAVTIPLFRAFGRAFGDPAPPDRGIAGGVGLVVLDAHPDLFDTYDGSPLSNACPARRALETGKLRPEHLLLLGTRSYNPEELDFIQQARITFVPARELDRRGVDAVVALARERLSGVRDVYLSLDIDVADPACAPGTGAPVAGGLSSRQLLDLTRGLLEALPVRAMDLVEIAPPLDPTEATLFLGLQLAFETFATVARNRTGVASPSRPPSLAGPAQGSGGTPSGGA